MTVEWRAVVATVMAMLAPAAHAAFVNEAAPPAGPVAAAVPPPAVTTGTLAAADADGRSASSNPIETGAGSRVTQIGYHPADLDIPKGEGRRIALADVLPVVVPPAYRVDAGDVDLSRAVSWSGGLPWDTVLTNALKPLRDVQLTLDWNAHVVSLHRMTSPGVLGQPPVMADSSSIVPVSALDRARTVATVSPGAAPSAESRFGLLGGQSLETQLTDWAKRAGWSITWSTPDDWIVPHDTYYGNDFQEAVKKVFTQLADDGADVRVDIWQGNKTVVVDKSGVSQ